MRSDNPAPVAYAQYYDSFPANQTIKENILKGITVYENRVEIPLAIAPIYNLEKVNAFKFNLDLSEIKVDLDWVHYTTEEKASILIRERDAVKLEISLSKPVKAIEEEKWENNNLVLIFKYSNPELKVCIDPGHGGLKRVHFT